ncbi:hypothetical protein OXX79_013139, partial [Metschnikowia pulcherrima]
MGRRAKNKQGVPPSMDDFLEKKTNKSSKPQHREKRKRSDEGEKRSKKPVKKSRKDEEEIPEDLPEVDLKELASAKKSLFDDDNDSLPEDDEFDVEELEGENDEFNDSDEEGRARPIFSDDED